MDNLAVVMRVRRHALRLVGVMMFVIVAVVMNVVMVMAVLVMLVIVMLAVGAQGHFRAGLKIGQRRLRIGGTSTGSAHLSDLQPLDFQFFTRKPVQIGAATTALAKGP